MQSFFKYVFATVIGIFTFIAFCVLVVFLMALSGGDSDKTYVKSNTILKLDLDRTIQEIEQASSPFDALMGESGPRPYSIAEIKTALKNAAADKHIVGIYLKAEYPSAGWATLEEVRESLLEFKKSKKFIYSYAETQSEKGYYLASVADQIYLQPSGGLELNGLSVSYPFFKGMFEKLEIKPEIFRVGTYKSAVEPYFLDKMSPESRQQTEAFLSVISKHYIQKLADSRGLSYEAMNAIINEDRCETPALAVKEKIITKAAYYDEFETDLKKKLGLEAKKSLSFVSVGAFAKADPAIEEEDSDNKIAIVVADGAIVSGNGEKGEVGSDKFIKALRKVRENKDVKAIVLRVNSPGGSALASDAMYREIELTKKVKPVVCSMGDYAASGGYYLAMAANKIIAQPTTITGSIGVFGVLFNVEGFMNHKLGITTDGVNTHTYADTPAITRTMSEAEKAKMQRSTEQIYETFTALAAKSRKMSQDSLKSIASGRVWSGLDAKRIGLVDELGNYRRAIEVAAEMAHLKKGDYEITFSAKNGSFFEEVVDQFKKKNEQESLKQALTPELLLALKNLKTIEKLRGVQASMPIGWGF